MTWLVTTCGRAQKEAGGAAASGGGQWQGGGREWASARLAAAAQTHDGDGELGGQLDELAQVVRELLLALGELAAARELDAEEAHDRVDDEQAVGLLVVGDLGHGTGELQAGAGGAGGASGGAGGAAPEAAAARRRARVSARRLATCQLDLVLVRERAADDDVVEHGARVEAVALLGDLGHALHAEGVLRVDDDDLAGAAAVLAAELRRHAQLRAELRLARAELAEELRASERRAGSCGVGGGRRRAVG